MLIFTFGIIQFNLCWAIIADPVKLVKFIKERLKTLRQPIYGICYAAVPSEHPE